MHARSHYLLAAIGMTTKPDPQTLAREKLADIMPTIAVFTEALNYAHFNLLGSSELDWQTSLSWGPDAITSSTDKRHPHEGMYDRWFHFLNGRDGTEVSANWHDPKFSIMETKFSIDATADGRFEVYTQAANYRTVRRETVATVDDALEHFGAWMKRNFDTERLRQVEAWVPKVMDGKMSLMPQPRTNWVGPFTAEGRSAQRRLTA